MVRYAFSNFLRLTLVFIWRRHREVKQEVVEVVYGSVKNIAGSLSSS